VPGDDGCEHARSDARHVRKIRFLAPNGVVNDGGQREGLGERKHRQHGCEQPVFAQDKAHQRKSQVEDFFDRERPQYVPTSGQIPGMSLIPVEIEPKGRSDSTVQRLTLLVDYVIRDVDQIKRRENRDKCNQARKYPCSPSCVKGPCINCT
jgi:hypothetical protein